MTLTDKLLEGERLNGGERLYLLQLVFERDEAYRLRDAIQLVEQYGMTVIREVKP